MAENEYLERPDIHIENGVATWSLKAEGDLTGTYTGTFKFKCYLTPTDFIAIGRENRELLGPNSILATEKEAFYAYALPALKYRVISSPPFWETSLKTGKYAGDIPDENIITMVLNAAVSAEIKFKHELNKRKMDAVDRAKKAAEKILEQQKADDNDGEAKESSDQP